MLATGQNDTEIVRLMLFHKADAYEANQVSMRERESERERERGEREQVFLVF